eukprot:m.165715 g.165715  ORF g.165715 m.165715 type:complete len:75 (-) comp53124_c0_seq6:373-597(-)
MPNEVITLSQYQKVESKLTKATKSRRESFPNTEDFEQYLSTRPAFSRWDARVRHAWLDALSIADRLDFEVPAFI